MLCQPVAPGHASCAMSVQPGMAGGAAGEGGDRGGGGELGGGVAGGADGGPIATSTRTLLIPHDSSLACWFKVDVTRRSTVVAVLAA